MTAIAMITVILIIVCSISGAAMPYVKGEKMFKFIRYLVEVITSAAAGFIVFLLLRVTDIPGEWIAAFSGIAAYFVNFQRFPTLDAKKLVNAPKMSAHHRGICHF